MSVIASYIAVVIIWSTTPLAIKLSNESFGAHAAILWRMLIAFVVAAVVIAIYQHAGQLKRKNIKIYAAGAVAIFPNMSLVYMAAEYIPSALIAVLFAMTPITTGIWSWVLLRQQFFSRGRLLAFSLALFGLVFISIEQFALSNQAWMGLLLMFASNLLFSWSQVMVKKMQPHYEVAAFEQTFGAITLALPGLLLSWLMLDGEMVSAVSQSSVAAIAYLGLVGSLIGFLAYFVVLRSLDVAFVTLIPLITPGLALWFGAIILDEPVTLTMCAGTALIVLGIALYDGIFDGIKRMLCSVPSIENLLRVVQAKLG